MASDYRIKAGFNVALGSLNVLSPQPYSEGVKATRRDNSGNGSVTEQGYYVELVFSIMGSKAKYQAVLTACGLSSALYTGVTVYCRNDVYDYTRYNGVAVRPAASWQQHYPRNVIILVRDLELAT